MKKKILIICVLLSQFLIKAQLDLEHWFPPVFNTGGTIFIATISLSTDKETPFKVYIYNYDTLLDTVTISKSNPSEYQLKDIETVFNGFIVDTMKPINSGIHLVGENSFYANLKLDGENTEVISSKGKSALGTSFFVVNDQTSLNGGGEPQLINYQASITAYHDNTHIVIKNYRKGLIFINGFKGDEIDVTLNKNQSYILAALFKDNMQYDIDTFDPNLIGAEITSDKSIVVSNGNCLSQDLGHVGPGSVNIDQSLPVSKLGKEYFLVNGMSNGIFKMEKALIVTTEDNTQLFFNNEITPFITLNKGQHYTGPYNGNKSIIGNEDSFTNEDGRLIPTSGTLIRSSKPIYCYQLIGTFYSKVGPRQDFSESLNTSALLLSYPLDVDYQNKSIQLLNVDLLGPDDYRRSKISIKSEDDAKIKINGVTLNGGSPITGKQGWKYNTIIGSKGDLNIESDKSLNIDFVSGGISDKFFPHNSRLLSGYAGSIVSYSNDPILSVSGNCLEEGIFLSINKSDFDNVQWFKDGIPIANANDYSFNPTEEGLYTCVVTYSNTQYTTSSFKVIHCPYTVVEKDFGKICDNLVVTPVFSSPNENQTFDKLEILTQPLSGKVVADNFSLVYTPNPGFTGQDRFVYRICSSISGICETVKAEVFVNKKPIAEIKNNLYPKSSYSVGNIIYDLTEAIIDQGPNTYDFFEDSDLAKPILDPSNYKTSADVAFVKISDPSGCFIAKEINLLFTEDVDLPNFFSPNGDGINDYWDFSKLKAYLNVTLSIYNRYGRKVFDFKNLNEEYNWPGKDFSGRTLKTDTYWAIIKWDNSKTGLPIIKKMYIVLKSRN